MKGGNDMEISVKSEMGLARVNLERFFCNLSITFFIVAIIMISIFVLIDSNTYNLIESITGSPVASILLISFWVSAFLSMFFTLINWIWKESSITWLRNKAKVGEENEKEEILEMLDWPKNSSVAPRFWDLLPELINIPDRVNIHEKGRFGHAFSEIINMNMRISPFFLMGAFTQGMKEKWERAEMLWERGTSGFFGYATAVEVEKLFTAPRKPHSVFVWIIAGAFLFWMFLFGYPYLSYELGIAEYSKIEYYMRAVILVSGAILGGATAFLYWSRIFVVAKERRDIAGWLSVWCSKQDEMMDCSKHQKAMTNTLIKILEYIGKTLPSEIVGRDFGVTDELEDEPGEEDIIPEDDEEILELTDVVESGIEDGEEVELDEDLPAELEITDFITDSEKEEKLKKGE